jgi:hypothetical protein
MEVAKIRNFTMLIPIRKSQIHSQFKRFQLKASECQYTPKSLDNNANLHLIIVAIRNSLVAIPAKRVTLYKN